MDEDVASSTVMFCATLTLTSGFTLETTILAPFDVDEMNTGKV